jgi:hypothetical protein
MWTNISSETLRGSRYGIGFKLAVPEKSELTRCRRSKRLRGIGAVC